MIYTKKGDKGESEILGGKKFLKNNLVFEVLGNLDELNSLIGVCKNKAESFSVKILDLTLVELLESIQRDLFIFQSIVAGAEKIITLDNIESLEKQIDFIEKEIPALDKFIIGGGEDLANFLNLTRSVVRRTERSLVALNEKKSQELNLLIYLNRLSDLFFNLYRFVNFYNKYKEKYF
ncbi:MAG: cob(I)yrinic acid a,c-diamide adenosyltransferase [Patescibacteria group bacterium]